MRTAILALTVLLIGTASGEWIIEITADNSTNWVLSYGRCDGSGGLDEIHGNGSDRISVDSREYDCFGADLMTSAPENMAYSTCRAHADMELYFKNEFAFIGPEYASTRQPISVSMVKPVDVIEYERKYSEANATMHR